MDGWRLDKAMQFLSFNCSRFGSFVKFGDFFSFREWLRFRTFRFSRHCQNICEKEIYLKVYMLLFLMIKLTCHGDLVKIYTFDHKDYIMLNKIKNKK